MLEQSARTNGRSLDDYFNSNSSNTTASSSSLSPPANDAPPPLANTAAPPSSSPSLDAPPDAPPIVIESTEREEGDGGGGLEEDVDCCVDDGRLERQLKEVMINENLNSMLNSMLKTGQTMFPATRPTCRLPTSQQSIDDYLQSFCSRDVMFFDSLALMSGVKRTFGDRHGQEGVGWRPRCVDCDDDNVILKGKTERARLCYDRDDMWVVAMPRRWLCNECNHAFGDYKIRDQLVKARPSLDRLLPHFTEKAAITTRS